MSIVKFNKYQLSLVVRNKLKPVTATLFSASMVFLASSFMVRYDLEKNHFRQWSVLFGGMCLLSASASSALKKINPSDDELK